RGGNDAAAGVGKQARAPVREGQAEPERPGTRRGHGRGDRGTNREQGACAARRVPATQQDGHEGRLARSSWRQTIRPGARRTYEGAVVRRRETQGRRGSLQDEQGATGEGSRTLINAVGAQLVHSVTRYASASSRSRIPCPASSRDGVICPPTGSSVPCRRACSIRTWSWNHSTCRRFGVAAATGACR